MYRPNAAPGKLRLQYFAAIFAVWFTAALVFGPTAFAQSPADGVDPVQAASADDSTADFRIEKVPVAGGAEILTIFARTRRSETEIPLISVLRDTLGDDRPANAPLRYVRLLSNTTVSR